MQQGSKEVKQHTIFALAAILYATPLQAAELSTVVVTADRVGQSETAVSADTTVIDRKAIEQSQASSVSELLRSQVGVDVVSSGGIGKLTSVFLRGANSGHTLVLIDGVRVGAATTGSFDWANLSTADIERIEIVRGAQSSLYGADAIGGVIQIFTRQGEKGTQVQLQSEAGSYATISGMMQLRGKTAAGISYALTSDGVKTNGISVAANGTENDPYRRTTLSGRVNIPVGEGELNLIARSVRGHSSLDGGFPFGDVLNYTNATKQSMLSAKLTYPLTDTLESSIQISRSNDEAVGQDPVNTFNNSDFRTQIDQLSWQNHIDLDSLSLLAGIDIFQSSGDSNSAPLHRKMLQSAAFAVFAWDTDWGNLNASIRRDRNSITSSQTTYKTGIALHPLDGLKVTANYGTGFKAPSLNDLYFPTSLFASGNPALKAETSQGWDAGVAYHHQLKALEGDIAFTWFQQNYRNLIVWQASPTFFYSPANIGTARTQGLEIEATIAYHATYLKGNWTYLDAKDQTTGTRLPRRAREAANITLGTTIANLQAAAIWHRVGARYSSPGNTKPMAAYQKVDLRLSYAINKQWKLTARVENAGDKRYEEVSGYGVRGRSWYGGVSSTF